MQHIPFMQTMPDAQACPQLAQLLGSLLRSLQAPEQQAGVVPVQTWPQAPQLFLSLCSLTQVLLQQFWPEGQSPDVPQVQAPLEHVSPEAHTWPQVPQFLGSVPVFTQALTLLQ